MYTKIQTDILIGLSFKQHKSGYMRSNRLVNGIDVAMTQLCGANLHLVHVDTTWYAFPSFIRRCDVCVGVVTCSKYDMGSFVSAIFAILFDAGKVYSGATQNIVQRVRSHQSDFLPHEEWTHCHVIFCTHDIELARHLETIQNNIVHYVARFSNGRISTPNQDRSLQSRGLRGSTEDNLHTSRLYTLYLLTRNLPRHDEA